MRGIIFCVLLLHGACLILLYKLRCVVSCGVVERMVVRLLSFIAGTRVSVCIIIADVTHVIATGFPACKTPNFHSWRRGALGAATSTAPRAAIFIFPPRRLFNHAPEESHLDKQFTTSCRFFQLSQTPAPCLHHRNSADKRPYRPFLASSPGLPRPPRILLLRARLCRHLTRLLRRALARW
jgi:hypothetical protein